MKTLKIGKKKIYNITQYGMFFDVFLFIVIHNVFAVDFIALVSQFAFVLF